MSNFSRINDFSNKFSDNILTYKSVLPDTTTFNVTDGTGVSGFVNDAYYGNFATVLCQSYKTNDFTFNFGDALTTPITKDGIYVFQLSIFDTDATTEFFVPFEFGVNVYKNGVFDQTIRGQMVGNYLVNSKKTITFSQNIECTSVTELDFTFTIFADVSYPFDNMNFNIGNFKLEHDNKFLNAPTPYSLPMPEQATGWQSITDIVNTQVILADTETQIIFTGVEQQNGDLDFLDNTGVITPLQEGDTLTVDVAFSFVVPSGTTNYFSFYIKIDGIIFRGLSVPMVRDTGAVQFFSQSYTLPVSSSFIGNSARCYIDSNVGITLSNRYITVSRNHKAKV